VRASIPSLSVLSDAQLATVWSAFDVDNSGAVDFEEFSLMLRRSMDSKENEGKVGVRWSTSGCEKEARACDWEQNLSEAFGRLFYSHRKELFHIWHSNFELDESNSMGKEDFVAMLRALDESTGKHLLTEEGLKTLADGMDLNGDGRIDFKEFCSNIGEMASTY
jgi:serine/threonine-protein phosphatase with EF-hand domain